MFFDVFLHHIQWGWEEEATREVIMETGLEAELVKENDIVRIMEYGIPGPPGSM